MGLENCFIHFNLWVNTKFSSKTKKNCSNSLLDIFSHIYFCYYKFRITSTSVAIIREKSGILEHTDGGFVAGAIYNIKNGIRGVIVGGGLGGVLGTIFGTITYVILLISGKTMEDIRLYTREWKTEREE